MIHYNIFFSLGIEETVDLSDMGLIMFDSLREDGTVDDAIASCSGAVEIDGKYMVATDGVHAKDADRVVYVAAVYSDGTAIHCTGVLPYSIGAYLTSHAAKETNFQAMAQAAAIYSYYAREYFAG